jgi:hypothetical protein
VPNTDNLPKLPKNQSNIADSAGIVTRDWYRFFTNLLTQTYNSPSSGGSGAILINNQTVSADYTIASGTSGVSAGPITIANGVTVTVAAGSKWVIV